MADEVKGDGSIKVELRKPVIANGEEVKELVFREPTGGDIERCGNPVLINIVNGETHVNFDAKAMTAMMSILASVPPSTIRAVHPKDWNTIAWRLADFFVPDLE